MKVRVIGNKVIVDGYVNAVERLSKVLRDRLGDFMERVKVGAFDKGIKKRPIHLLYNHDWEEDYGDTESGELTLVEDSIGLRAHVEVDNPKFAEHAKEGFKGWSFGFMDVPDGVKMTNEEGLPVRNLYDLDLYEVSLIGGDKIPAYDGTSAIVRADGQTMLLSGIEEAEAEVEEVPEAETEAEVEAESELQAEIEEVAEEVAEEIDAEVEEISEEAEEETAEEAVVENDNERSHSVDYTEALRMIKEMKEV